MAERIGLFPGHQHGFLCAQRAEIEHKRLAQRRDLLNLPLVLRHGRRAVSGQNDVRAVVDGYIVRDRVNERPHLAGARHDLLQDLNHRSEPSSRPSAPVRPKAASTVTETAAPTAVETRKDGTKVNSAAARLFSRNAATG